MWLCSTLLWSTLALFPLSQAVSCLAVYVTKRCCSLTLQYPLKGGARYAAFQIAAVPAALPSQSLPPIGTTAAVMSCVFLVKSHLVHHSFQADYLRSASGRVLAYLLSFCGVLALSLLGSALLLTLDCDLLPVLPGELRRLVAYSVLPCFAPELHRLTHVQEAHDLAASPLPENNAEDAFCALTGVELPLGTSNAVTAVEYGSSRQLIIAIHVLLALACLIASSLSSHGVAGHVMHAVGCASTRGWRFFQPFQGGTVFIATQCAGWTTFALAALGLLEMGRRAVLEVLHFSPVPVAVAVALAPLCLSASVLLYGETHSAESAEADAAAAASGQKPRLTFSHFAATAYNRLCWIGVLALLFLPAHFWALFVCLPFTALPWPVALASLVVVHSAYGYLTLRGQPQLTGCRYWPAFNEWLHVHLDSALNWWMGSCQVIKGFEGDLDPQKRYIFTYMPHGILPAGAAYAPYLKSWRSLFPGIAPVTLTANVMHYVPIMKDIGAWTGFRAVSRASFRRALEADRHVIMCPGGQAELVHSSQAWRKSRPTVQLCTRHKGFCRMAIQHQAELVPMLCYGEILQLKNAVSWSFMQRLSYRKIGFPVPYLVVGAKYSPFPACKPCAIVIGEPVKPPKHEDEVNDFHARYYEAIRQLWDRTKHLHPAYADFELSFDSHDSILQVPHPVQ